MARMTTLGLIVGNWGFFPAHLCESGRTEILATLEEEGLYAGAESPRDLFLEIRRRARS